MKRDREEEDEVPIHLVCPITRDLFKDPVLASDGYTYERDAIKTHLKSSKISPMTRSSLTETLTSNRSILDAIDAYQNNGTESSKKIKTDDADFVFNYDYIEKMGNKEYRSVLYVQKKEIIFALIKSGSEYTLDVWIPSMFFIEVCEFEKTFQYKDKSFYKITTKDISDVKNAVKLLRNALLNKAQKQELERLYPSYSDIINISFNSQQAIFNILLSRKDDEKRNIPLSEPCSVCRGLSTTSMSCCSDVICLYCLLDTELKENVAHYTEGYNTGNIRTDDSVGFKCPRCNAEFDEHYRKDEN